MIGLYVAAAGGMCQERRALLLPAADIQRPLAGNHACWGAHAQREQQGGGVVVVPVMSIAHQGSSSYACEAATVTEACYASVCT